MNREERHSAIRRFIFSHDPMRSSEIATELNTREQFDPPISDYEVRGIKAWLLRNIQSGREITEINMSVYDADDIIRRLSEDQ